MSGISHAGNLASLLMNPGRPPLQPFTAPEVPSPSSVYPFQQPQQQQQYQMGSRLPLFSEGFAVPAGTSAQQGVPPAVAPATLSPPSSPPASPLSFGDPGDTERKRCSHHHAKTGAAGGQEIRAHKVGDSPLPLCFRVHSILSFVATELLLLPNHVHYNPCQHRSLATWYHLDCPPPTFSCECSNRVSPCTHPSAPGTMHAHTDDH